LYDAAITDQVCKKWKIFKTKRESGRFSRKTEDLSLFFEHLEGLDVFVS